MPAEARIERMSRSRLDTSLVETSSRVCMTPRLLSIISSAWLIASISSVSLITPLPTLGSGACSRYVDLFGRLLEPLPKDHPTQYGSRRGGGCVNRSFLPGVSPAPAGVAAGDGRRKE